MFKRIFLFLITNIIIVLTISVIIFFLEQFFGIKITGNIISGYQGLFIFSLLFGFSGAFFSLLISRWVAKKSYDITLLSEDDYFTYDHKAQLVYTTVVEIAKRSNITTPEVGVYISNDINAFATGFSKNKSLVAVSSGLLENMTSGEIEGVVAHEMSHIISGDMVTMTLLQGVLNTFVIFFARIIGTFVDKMIFRSEENQGWGYMVSVIILEIIFGLLASLVLMYFSRYREYRADEGSVALVGKDKMISALRKLDNFVSNKNIVDDGKMSIFKIHSEIGIAGLFMTHPTLNDRIQNLEIKYN